MVLTLAAFVRWDVLDRAPGKVGQPTEETGYLLLARWPVPLIAIEGQGVKKKINCGGPAYQDYAADWPQSAPTPCGLPTDDFYLDWATVQFGQQAGPLIARIFAKIDNRLPRPTDWIDGPGGIAPDPRPWTEAARDYAFVDVLAGLRPSVQGKGNIDRFDYWLENFRYMKAIAHLKCVWAEFNNAMGQVEAEKDAEAKKQITRQAALPLREQMIQRLQEVYEHLWPTVRTSGAMGTVTNWEQHIRPVLLTKPGEALAQALGEPLPAEAMPSNAYQGPMRIVVPTVQGSMAAGEALSLKVIVLSADPPRKVMLYWRNMGEGDFIAVPLRHGTRGIYTASVPACSADTIAIEYYVNAVAADGQKAHFPVTAPAINQTVVIMPEAP